MKELSIKELNEIAMQIILHAGNSRTLMGEVIDELAVGNYNEVKKKMLEAKSEITKAHRMQTMVIQDTIECETFKPTFLFIHAQDTLMTINSELFIVEYMIKLELSKK